MTPKTWIVEPERIIIEVESRPLLYAKALPEYSNKSLRNDAWAEIAENVSKDWEDLTSLERNIRCEQLQAKWKHIRDNFRREYQIQKDVTSGKCARKRTKYRYFDDLLFLVPHVKDANTSGNYDKVKKENNDNNQNSESQSSLDSSRETEVFASTVVSRPTLTASVQRTESRHRKRKSTFEDEVLEVLRNDKAECDEDRTFCLSLVQSLRRMNDVNKISAKIEILNVIRRFSSQSTKL